MNSAAPPSPFSFPLFRFLWLANLVSTLGYLIQSVGASWLMAELSPSPRMVALVQTSTTLPVMLLALLAGAVADNRDRRRVMIAAQTFMLAVSACLAVVAATGLISPPVLLGFTFLIGCGTAMNNPAWQASVGDIVPKPALPAAVAYNSIAFNVARSSGPAIGGMIVAAAGPVAAFLTNCLSYLGLLGVLLRWRPPRREDDLPPERIAGAIGSGLRYVTMSPDLLRVIARAGMFSGATSAITALTPVIARDLLGGGAITYGLLLGGFGVGAIGGALASPRLRRRMSVEGIVTLATAAVAGGACIAAVGRSLPATLPGLALAGGGWILGVSTLNVTVQLASPRWVVARAISTYQMATFGGMALGSWLFGMAAAAHGIPAALFGSAGLQLAAIVAGRAIRLPDIDDLNLDPLRRWSEPSTLVPMAARSGPVAVTIRYLIATDDIPAFLREMSHWRRVRLRDGARRWTLYRDLSDPELWIERYHVPTWLDYVRHNQRRTHADAAHGDRIRRLHRGDGPPQVQRMLEVHPAHYSPGAEAEASLVARPFTDHG